MARYHLVAITREGYRALSGHDELMDAIVAIAKVRARSRATTLVVRCGATGARLSVQDCEDYMLTECRLSLDESPERVWRRLAA